MDAFNVSHLDNKDVIPFIQNAEALFLYSLILSNKIERILELGGGGAGYSSKNFLEAIKTYDNGVLYTVDIDKVPSFSHKHKVIIKDCNDLTSDDIDNIPIDLVFFDCHTILPQLNLFNNLCENKMINDNTILVLHDTNLYFQPHINNLGLLSYVDAPYDSVEDGFEHQWVERQMVNYFKLKGYDVFSLKTRKNKHDENFTHRHGLTVCQKFKPLTPIYLNYQR